MRKFFPILIFVTCAHLAAFFSLALFAGKEPPLPPKEKLLVRTVKLNPPKPQVVASKEEVKKNLKPVKEKPKEPVVKKEAPKKNPEPVVKKEKKPEPVVKKEIPKKKAEPVVKKEVPKKNPEPTPKKVDPEKEKLIAIARESLSKVKSQKSSILKDLVKIESMNIDSSADESSYYGLLTSKLRSSLQLPEMGQVKISLTLDQTGKVIKVQSLGSKSPLNVIYIESNVPSISFPPFGKSFGNEKEHTFIITFTNEI